MKKIFLFLFFALFLAGCSSPADGLNGTWDSTPVYMQIDISKGVMNGTALGMDFSSKIKVISEEKSTIVLEIDGKKQIVTIVDKDNIKMPIAGSSGVSFTRVNK